MRSTRIVPLLLFGILLTFQSGVYGQSSSSLTYSGANQVGLTPVWTREIAVGYGGEISGVTVFVSPTKSYRGSSLIDKFGRRTYFSDRDAASLRGSRAGYDETVRRLELKEAQLTALGLEPQSTSVEIPDVTLYVRSSLGTVTALDAETGELKWSTEVGKPGYPGFGITATDEYVVTLSSATVYLLDAESGQVLSSVPLRFLPASTPTIVGKRIFAPGASGVIDVLSTEDLNRREYTLGSAGGIDSPVTVSPRGISWSSDDRVYVANPVGPGVRYHFQTMDTLTASPVYQNERLFITSMDGFAYAIDEQSGDVQWRYSAGGPVREAPLVIDDNVYVTTVDGQMSALDAESGEARWLASNVDRFVAVSDSRVYCISIGNQLVVRDRENGGIIGSTQLGPVGHPVVNTNTDRVYLVSQSGVVQCFRDAAKRWPTARKPPELPFLEEEGQAAKAPTQVEVAPDPAPSAGRATEEADTDPFGMEDEPAESAPAPAADDGAEEDPFEGFGADDFGSDDFGGDGAAGDDPFRDF